MSIRHPIISITGSSGAGTSTVKHTFEQIFRREGITAAFIEGDAFHRYDRAAMRTAIAEATAQGNNHLSHFGPEANLLAELEAAFESYGRTGTGRTRYYVHDQAEAEKLGCPPGTFTPWTQLPSETDVLFYEGLHGAVVTDTIDIAKHADLKIGVVPVINLEWTQKIHRDRASRGYTVEAVTDTILRRMPDYVNYICPQFGMTDINFQRVPTVDTSNPFIARWIPDPRRIDGGDPLRQPARHRLLLSGLDDPRQLHVAGQLHRHSGQQARSGDAAHPHADDPQTGRAPAARGLKNRTETHNMTQVTTRDLANAVRALAMDAVEQAQIRPSRHADGHGRRGHRAVDALPALRPRTPGLAGPRPLRAVRRTRLDAAVCVAAPHRLPRHRHRRAQALPPARRKNRGPSGIRPRGGDRDHHRTARPGHRHRRRHGAGRAHAGRHGTARRWSITIPMSSPAMAA